MRIDLLGATAVAADRTGTAVSSSAQATGKQVPVDTATLSEGSLSVPSLSAQALQQAESRLEKVSALNRAVNSGAYTLDPGVIAQAIVTSGA